MHEAIEEKILTVYMRYQVEEMLDQYGYAVGERMLEGRGNGGSDNNNDKGNGSIYNFEQLVGYLIKEKIVSLS